MNDADGSFYCFVSPRSPPLSGWFLSRSKSERLVHSKLDQVLASWEDDAVVTGGSSDDGAPPTTPTTPVGLLRQGSLPQTQSYVYKHAGLTVKLGLQEVASDLYRVKPHVYCAPDNAAAIVFSGCLHNLPELSRRAASGAVSRGSRGSGAASPADLNNAMPPLERQSSLERSIDVGQLTARTVLQLYMDVCSTSGDLIMLLSELQGEFSFVIWDARHRTPFAARDPSGEESLFFHTCEDGALSFASDRLAVPDGEQPHEWRELPPGHYLGGRPLRLHQFALTPQQLAAREALEDDELDELGAPRHRPLATTSSLGGGGVSCALPLNYAEGAGLPDTARRGSLDGGGIFALDL